MKSYRDYEVYKLSYQFALEIHRMTMKLSKEIQFDLADQVRRASKSIPTNFAEGFGRKKSQKVFRKFLLFSIGSNDETLVHLDFLKDLDYIDEKQYLYFRDNYLIVGKMLTNFIKKIETNSG